MRASSGPAAAVSPTVVLVHGVVSSRYLAPTARVLAPSCRVLAPDLPGFGASPTPPGAVLDIAGYADTLAAALSAAGVAGATVVGHSVGAQVVVELALRHPWAAGRLVLAGPTVDPRARSLRAQYGRWLANVPGEPVAFNLLLAREIIEIGPQRMLSTFRHALSHPIADRLPALAIPVLVVRGEKDRVAPQRWAEEIAASVANARVAVIADAAHSVVYNAPVELAQIISDFSRSCESLPGNR